jgi:thiol-disulfide isomerase/thioredoxin
VLPIRDRAAQALAVVLMGMATSVAAEPTQTLVPVQGSKAAPELNLELVDGGRLALSSLRGKVVMVNFWASWCPPCRGEMPSLERLKGLEDDARFEVVAINAGEAEDDIAAFRASMSPPLTFRLAFDRKGEAMRAFAVKGLPTTIVIDRQGRIAYRAVGGRQFDDPGIVNALDALMVK